jgi:hypothetical protein
MLQKPETTKLYQKPLPTEQFPPKKFSYESEQPLSMPKIIWYGLVGEELIPKNFRKYEDFMLHVKITTLTLLIVGGFVVIMFNSNYISQSAAGEYEYKPTYMDYVIDFCIDIWNEVVDYFKNLDIDYGF